MFLIQYIIGDLLHLVIDAVLLLGIAGMILAYLSFFIPILIPYKPAIKLISVILLIIGSYFKGMFSADDEWQKKIAETEAKLKVAEEAAKHENVRIETQVIERVKIVKEKVHENKKAIQTHKTEIDAQCQLPDVARMLYNRAVTHDIPGSTPHTNATSTRTKPVISE